MNTNAWNDDDSECDPYARPPRDVDITRAVALAQRMRPGGFPEQTFERLCYGVAFLSGGKRGRTIARKPKFDPAEIRRVFRESHRVHSIAAKRLGCSVALVYKHTKELF